MSVIEAFQAELAENVVTVGPDVDPCYLSDFALDMQGKITPLALLRPRTTAQVSTIMKLCSAHRVPLVSQGGRTGLAGGAVPINGAAILSLERMRAIGPVDHASATIQVEAGAILQNVQEAADAAGLLFPLDIGARGSCTIGGNIATNAGGTHVLRYGMMRELVLGLEVVLANGTVISALNTMLKNNAGYDLKHVFIGSEGTLGVITRAVLRLFPRPTNSQTALCMVASYADALALLALARARSGSDLTAFELMWPDFYALSLRSGRRPPLPPADVLYVLVETMGVDETQNCEHFGAMVAEALNEGIIIDAVIAQSEQQREALWSIRDTSGELPVTLGPNVNFDVGLPIARIGEFVDTCRERLAENFPGADCVFFGHVADSNIHINIHVPGVEHQPHEAIDQIVYDCVAAFGGTISAEHGIGVLKRSYLNRSRSVNEMGLMACLKHALDPEDILNPGKLLELPAR